MTRTHLPGVVGRDDRTRCGAPVGPTIKVAETVLENVYEWMRRETVRIGREILGDPDANIRVTFSRVYTTEVAAECWPSERRIVYHTNWVELNVDNRRFLYDLIVHECVHLKHVNHNKHFRELCKRYGCHTGYYTWYSDSEGVQFPPHRRRVYEKHTGEVRGG